MPYFTLDSVDYDQSGGGLPFAMTELQEQLPVAVKAVRQIPGPDRDDYFLGLLQRPITYHPRPDFDWTRTQPEFIGRDDAGPYLSIYAVVVCSLFVGTQLHAGMRSLPVRVALVIDNALGRDDTLDFRKCEYAAQGFISDLPGGPDSVASEHPSDEHDPSADDDIGAAPAQ
jgi:hypothetical protein